MFLFTNKSREHPVWTCTAPRQVEGKPRYGDEFSWYGSLHRQFKEEKTAEMSDC